MSGSPPPSFYEVHQRIGEVELTPHSRVLVSAVQKDGTWLVRLSPYRLARRGAEERWVPVNKVLLFPPESIASLCELVQRGAAFAGAPPDAAALAGDETVGLTADEIAAEDASELPDREALSLIAPDLHSPKLP